MLHCRLHIRPGEQVIDIACGPGRWRCLAGSGAPVTAIDHSDAMVGRLRARAEQAGLGARLQAQAMDGQALLATWGGPFGAGPSLLLPSSRPTAEEPR